MEEWREQYHSTHGAIQESRHVFIDSGFSYLLPSIEEKPLRILEFGFGTGLNALLTCLESNKFESPVHYTGIEAFPVSEDELKVLNYCDLLGTGHEIFKKLHEVSWEVDAEVNTNFTLKKIRTRFESFNSDCKFHIIYYDAFGARVQPELWTREFFEKIYSLLEKDGILVTYSSKGSVRRAMTEIGYEVERLQGPPGKRHMLRASKK